MMKKIYFLVAVIMMNIFQLSAQISMNFTTHGIVPGDVYKYFNADTTAFDPGTGGANHTWTFTGLVINNNLQTQNYIDPATTPYASSFPAATYALEQGGTYVYYKSNTLGTFTEGIVSTTVTLPYPDDEKMFVYPFTYTNTFSDYFSGADTVAGVNYKRYGQITTTGDGWGKLIINGRTYNNVLRVKIVQVIHDFQINISTEDTIVSTRTETLNYHWYRQNSKNPLLNYTQVDMYLEDIPDPISSTKAIFVDNTVTGINDKTSEPVNLVVYPNPTTGFVNLETNYSSPQKLNIELTNASGQVVYYDLSSVKAGRNVQKLDVSTLPLGIYAIRMYNDESVVVRKLILQ